MSTQDQAIVMNTLRPLRMRLLDSLIDPFMDPLAGEIVTVTQSPRTLTEGFKVKFRDGVKPRLMEDVEEFKVWASNLEILEEDLPMVPERVRKVSLGMASLWILDKARQDAYCYVPKTENELEAYEEHNGTAWVDDRVFEVAQKI